MALAWISSALISAAQVLTEANPTIESATAHTKTTLDSRAFRDLALSGNVSAKDSDRLIALLDDPNPNVRLGACEALGFTGQVEVWPHLARMLRQDDWRIAFGAAMALGRLDVKAAEKSLEKCRDTHWSRYPAADICTSTGVPCTAS